MANVVGDSLWRERFSAVLLGFIAVPAGLIASGGLQAVISQAEFGARLALGASAGQIAQTVLRWGNRIARNGHGGGDSADHGSFPLASSTGLAYR